MEAQYILSSKPEKSRAIRFIIMYLPNLFASVVAPAILYTKYYDTNCNKQEKFLDKIIRH